VDNEKNNQRVDNVFSSKVKAGKRRTYFFDIRQTKGEDYFLTLTESTKRFNGDGYERHKIFLYKEDINRFITGLEEAVKHLKENLMPEYDFDEYTRRQEEWEARRAEELLLEEQNPDKSGSDGVPVEKPKSEEDMTW